MSLCYLNSDLIRALCCNAYGYIKFTGNVCSDYLKSWEIFIKDVNNWSFVMIAPKIHGKQNNFLRQNAVPIGYEKTGNREVLALRVSKIDYFKDSTSLWLCGYDHMGSPVYIMDFPNQMLHHVIYGVHTFVYKDLSGRKIEIRLAKKVSYS